MIASFDEMSPTLARLPDERGEKESNERMRQSRVNTFPWSYKVFD